MSAQTDRSERSSGFARFLRTLGERWWLVLLIVAVVGGAAYGVSLILEPRYSATAQVIYSQRDADAVSKALADAGTAGLPMTLTNDSLVLQTSNFAERVSEALDGAVSADTLRSSAEVYVDADVELIDIKASAAQASLAADIANAYADEFILVRQEEIHVLLESALEFVRGQIISLTPEERAGSEGTELERQSYALRNLINNPIADYKVLEGATAPASPYFPRPIFNLLLGLAAGLVLGLLVVMIVSTLDRRIKDQETLERVLDLPIVGGMPTTAGRQGSKRTGIGFPKGGDSLLESMKMLRTNLKVLGFGDTKRTLFITSTTADEGKSSLAVNLTLSMALAGDRVILVDADLRDPSIHTYLNVPNTQGLGDVLTKSGAEWSENIQAVELAPFVDQNFMSSRKPEEGDAGVTKFLCLTSGALAVDPVAVLESRRFSDLLAELQGYSDYVIIDGPPMIANSDALVIARAVDSIVIASTLGKQTVAEARQVKQLLARAEIEALGVVLCGTRAQNRSHR